MTVAVIPIGPGRPSMLPHVVRTLATHTQIDELITVGERPTSITPDEHWPSPNDANPYVNVGGHLRLVSGRLEEPFVWTADDIFLLRDWTPTVHVRKYSLGRHLRDYPHVPTYSQAIRDTIGLLRGHDPDAIPCGPTHRPMLVDPFRLRVTLDRLDAAGIPGGAFKALYVVGLDEVTPAVDPKVRGNPRANLTKADCVSLDAAGWAGHLGAQIREGYQTPSRWES